MEPKATISIEEYDRLRKAEKVNEEDIETLVDMRCKEVREFQKDIISERDKRIETLEDKLYRLSSDYAMLKSKLTMLQNHEAKLEGINKELKESYAKLRICNNNANEDARKNFYDLMEMKAKYHKLAKRGFFARVFNTGVDYNV